MTCTFKMVDLSIVMSCSASLLDNIPLHPLHLLAVTVTVASLISCFCSSVSSFCFLPPANYGLSQEKNQWLHRAGAGWSDGSAWRFWGKSHIKKKTTTTWNQPISSLSYLDIIQCACTYHSRIVMWLIVAKNNPLVSFDVLHCLTIYHSHSHSINRRPWIYHLQIHEKKNIACVEAAKSHDQITLWWEWEPVVCTEPKQHVRLWKITESLGLCTSKRKVKHNILLETFRNHPPDSAVKSRFIPELWQWSMF